ncbi:hypothetical protein Tco_1106837 [Tanacetum coccineum]
MPMYPNPNPAGSFTDSTGSVTPFVRWNEDYPLLDGLKIPSHIGSYDGKGDPDNFLHLFEGAIRMRKWLMLVACHMFTYTLKDSARIWWNSQKAGSILNYEDLKAKHDINQCRELKHQIEEAVKSGKLAHLAKGVKKKKEKKSATQLGEWKKEEKDATPVEATILMIRRESHNPRKRLVEGNYGEAGEITFPSLQNRSSADPVIIRAYVSGRQVNRVYLDDRSLCEVIYEHCFLKLKLSIRSLRVDSKVPFVGFSGEKSWPIGEVPLEITIGEGPLTTTKTLRFVIELEEGQRTISEEQQKEGKDILSCVDAEEWIVVNDQYPEQTIAIGRQLPTKIKIKLQELLRAYANVFAWTTACITGVLRTIIIGEPAFNTEHRVNELKYLEPVKQKKRSLEPERNEAIHTQVEDLTKANILREVKYQTSQKPRGNQRNWNNQKSQQLGNDFVMHNKACYVCGSFDHLQYTCKQKRQLNGQREEKPVWNNARRVNHQNSPRITHPNPKRHMVPRKILTRSGPISLNTARQSYLNVVCCCCSRQVNTARQKAVVNAVRTNRVNAVKASACWVWRPGNPETKLEDLVRLNSPKDEKRAGAELTQQNDKSQYKK